MNKIIELRKNKLLTQKKLAELLGIDQTSVSHWERDKATPDILNLIKLANIFNVTIDYLTGRNNTVTDEEFDATHYNDIIEYAKCKGLTPDEIKQSIDFVIGIKEKMILEK